MGGKAVDAYAFFPQQIHTDPKHRNGPGQLGAHEVGQIEFRIRPAYDHRAALFQADDELSGMEVERIDSSGIRRSFQRFAVEDFI